MEAKTIGQHEWNEIVSHFEDLSLMQTWEYGEAKARSGGWKVARHLFWDENKILGAVQCIIKTVPFSKRGLVWMNRAPLWQRMDGDNDIGILIQMLKELRRYWVEEKKMYLLIAPTLLVSRDSIDFVETAGYSITPFTNWISARIDLTRSEESLRKTLRQKWRNCLNKAEKLGIEYEIGTSASLTDQLISDYRELLKNNNYKPSVTPEFLKSLQSILPEERKMWILTGRHEGEKLGSILTVSYGEIVEYLVGAVNDAGKKINTGQFLLWNAICEMKKRGFRWFDLGGAHPVKTPEGILHFKEGLGGDPYELIGNFDAYDRGIVSGIIRYVLMNREKRGNG